MSTMEKTTQTNDMGYAPIDARTLCPLGDQILVAWELCQDKLKVGTFLLERPDTHKKMHYTGEILAVGPDAHPDLQVGKRIVFDQFSDPDKYFDEFYGRVCLLKESKQGQLFMVINPRTNVEGSEPEYQYDAV